MANFAICNYQFAKVMRQVEEGRLFHEEGEMSADKAFPIKQEIFARLLNEDFQGVKPIIYKNKRGDKMYIHKFLIEPRDGIFIFKVANKHTTTIVGQDLNDTHIDDYQNCLVIIDNRDGIQRVLIEQKKSAFQEVRTLVEILEWTLNKYLEKYSLEISFMHLQEPRVFWDFVNDRRTYPQGFYKITFYLPPLNLKRLSSAYNRVLTTSREVFDSDLEWSYKASKGGMLPLDEKNKKQRELIEYMMSDVGSDSGRSNIKLYSNTAKQKPILVGENSYLALLISDTTFKRLLDEAKDGDLFGSEAFEEIKRKTKIGIDPDKKELSNE